MRQRRKFARAEMSGKRRRGAGYENSKFSTAEMSGKRRRGAGYENSKFFVCVYVLLFR